MKRSAPGAQLRGRKEASNLDAALVAPRGFVSAAAAQLLSRKVLLRFLELPVRSPGEPGSRDTFAIREDEQVFESKVYTNRVLRRRRLYIGHLELGCQGNVPVSCRISLERRALGLSFDLSGLADTNPT